MTTSIGAAPTGATDQELEVRPLTPGIGAEVHGVDLSQPLGPRALTDLRDAIVRWKVLFFRDQHVSHLEHVRFARQLGPLAIPTEYDPFYPTSYDEERPPPGYSDEEVVAWRDFPEITRVDNRRAQEFDARRLAKDPSALAARNTLREAHVDSLAFVNPIYVSILRAEIVPAVGGDTSWYDSVAAYEGLSGPVRRLVDSLWAEYVTELPTHFEGGLTRRYVTHHPVVRVIPETGERALLLGPSQTKRILDVSPDESSWLLAYLFEQLTRPAYGVHFRWDPHSIGLWDNRTTVHLAPQDLTPDVERVLHLVFVSGEPAVAVDGRRSSSVVGDPKPESPRAPLDVQSSSSGRPAAG
jgi:taurine dioxygenase